MGVSYTAHAVIGLRLSYDGVAGEPRTVPSCDHPERLGNAYCPVCGKKVGEKRGVMPTAYEVEERLDGLFPDGIDVVRLGGSEEEEPDFLIGVVAESRDYGESEDEFVPIPDIAALKETLKSVFEPLGLWDEESFGLHAGMDVSY